MEAIINKVDYKKKYEDLYNPSAKEVALVTVPPMQFLMIDGSGDPNGSDFQQAAGALDSYMQANNLVSNGKHHELYFGDRRRTKPEKLRTILRHPVK